MTLQQLKYFCAVTEVLHYTRAAKQLHISQPSLSYAIAELEKDLGLPLFEKHGRTPKLTAYGTAFLPYAKQALACLEEGQQQLEEMASPSGGSVNFGYIYSLSFDLLPGMVSSFYEVESNKSISIKFSMDSNQNLSNRLLDGSLDLALCVDPLDDAIETVPVFEQELFLVVSKDHPLASASSVSLDQIKDEQFISIAQKTNQRALLDEAFRSCNISPKILIEAEECNAIAAFVNSNIGISIMPNLPLLRSLDIALVSITPSITREVFLAWAKNRTMPPSVKRFRDYIINSPGDIQKWEEAIH